MASRRVRCSVTRNPCRPRAVEAEAPGSEVGAPAPSVETAESVEASLGLTFEERVLVQHGLASLGEDVGQADGVSVGGRGPGSGAISGRRPFRDRSPDGGLRDALVVLGEARQVERSVVAEEAARRERERKAEERRIAAERGADDEAFAGPGAGHAGELRGVSETW